MQLTLNNLSIEEAANKIYNSYLEGIKFPKEKDYIYALFKTQNWIEQIQKSNNTYFEIK